MPMPGGVQAVSRQADVGAASGPIMGPSVNLASRPHGRCTQRRGPLYMTNGALGPNSLPTEVTATPNPEAGGSRETVVIARRSGVGCA